MPSIKIEGIGHPCKSRSKEIVKPMPQIQESYLIHLNLDLVLLVQNSKNTLLVLAAKI